VCPCIAEIPHLKEVYSQYKDKGLEIVSISLDETKYAWNKALKKTSAPWIQLSNLQGIDSPLTKAYHISSIPQNILVNQNGNIVNVNLHGKDLDDKLRELMK
jgi:alkyl hydroperoxide reductase subunit AhpC